VREATLGLVWLVSASASAAASAAVEALFHMSLAGLTIWLPYRTLSPPSLPSLLPLLSLLSLLSIHLIAPSSLTIQSTPSPSLSLSLPLYPYSLLALFAGSRQPRHLVRISPHLYHNPAPPYRTTQHITTTNSVTQHTTHDTQRPATHRSAQHHTATL
jgi:hypothetical protein